MVSLNLILQAMMVTSTMAAWTFNTCKGTTACTEVTSTSPSKRDARGGRAGGSGRAGKAAKGAGSAVGGGALSAAGGELFNQIFNSGGSPAGVKSTRYSYQSKDGYWYSHDVRGLFIDPNGYNRFAGGLNYVAVWSKDGKKTLWTGPTNCCLPDGVGTGIRDVKAYA